MIKKLIHQYKNVKVVIEQINRGEWELNDGHECILVRKRFKLWIDDGPFFCDFYKPHRPNAFGWIFRHWVWFAGVRPFKERINMVKLY